MKILERPHSKDPDWGTPHTNGHAKGVTLDPLPQKRARVRRPLFIALAATLAIAIVLATLGFLRPAAQAAVITQPVTQGNLSESVTATGTVDPQNTVSVGTQVSGTISALYVDYNSKVKKGQVLARIDPQSFDDTLTQDQANLAQSQAAATAGSDSAAGSAAAETAAQDNIAAAKATLVSDQAQIAKAQSAFALAQQTVTRDGELLKQGYIAQSQYDTDQSNAVADEAALKAAQDAVTQAQAQEQAAVATAAQDEAQAEGSASTAAADEAAVSAQQAQVAAAQYNANNTVITSPVNGTVIARDISVGQTVAAGLQTPTLFSIAQDLSKMEVDLQVGEPDIGNVKAGDQVQFTVLAYPTRIFTGVVSQVRENPTTVQNVVTYTTVVLVDNKDGALLPGMTANATIDTASLQNATIVPIAALQWHPSAADMKDLVASSGVKPQHRQAAGGSSSTTSSPWGSTGATGSTTVVAGTTGRVFVDQNGKLQIVPVQVAMVSGASAAVTPARGTLTAGEAVVTADSTTTHAHAAAGNAFGTHTGGTSNPMHVGGGFHS